MMSSKVELYFGNIYRYNDSEGIARVGVYMCNTNLAYRVCIIPLEENRNDGLEQPIAGMDKVAYPIEFKEINERKIIGVLMIKGKIAKVTYEEYVTLSTVLTNALTDKVFCTYDEINCSRREDEKKQYAITENIYKYYVV